MRRSTLMVEAKINQQMSITLQFYIINSLNSTNLIKIQKNLFNQLQHRSQACEEQFAY